ncbi:MAG: hypothetical protein WAX57_03500 [Minisyncoccia bacterium]
MIRADQPGSNPLDIPEQIPNPVYFPKTEPAPQEPAPKQPVRVPERVTRAKPWHIARAFFLRFTALIDSGHGAG